MQLLSSFIEETQRDVVTGVQALVDSCGLRRRLLGEAQNLAQKVTDRIYDEGAPDPPVFPVLAIDHLEQELQYKLVLEYLDSIGLKFSPTVFRYESRHSEVLADRYELARRLHLRGYDRTPLLVQMIEERRKSMAKAD
jgi:hypothetical protein